MSPFRFTVAVVVALAAAVPAVVAAEEPRVPGTDGLPRENFHLYLLLGQSNMAGRGKMTPEDRQPVPGVWTLDAKGTWQPAAHPLHFDKPSMAGVGLGIDFAKTMRAGNERIAIGLIPCAFGGTRLDEWQRGSKLYQQAIERAAIGAKAGLLRGVLWHQGESDSTEELAPTYAARLQRMLADLRGDLQAPELPVVVGELGPFRQAKNPFTAEVNRQLALAIAEDPQAALASAAGLRDLDDQTHFDADSLREFGRRYGKAMRKLQK